jgi:hypothetical protein
MKATIIRLSIFDFGPVFLPSLRAGLRSGVCLSVAG